MKYRHYRKGLLDLCFSHVCLFTPVIHGSVEGKKAENNTRQSAFEKKKIIQFCFPSHVTKTFLLQTLEESQNLPTFQIRAEELTQHVATERTAPSGSLWGQCRCFRSSLRPTSRRTDTPGHEEIL